MHKQHSAFPSIDGPSTPLHQDENSGSSPLGGPSQSYVYNEKTHNGVQKKIFKKAGISIKKEEPELKRKRNELRAIREQIMLKRASVGLASSSFAIDDPELCSDDEETDRRTESNRRLQDERVTTLSLQDRVKRILLHRGCSKVIQTRRSPIKEPLDHPLKFRVQVALQKRFMDPPVEAPNTQIPMLAQEQDNQGFLRFLNILNKGMDIDKLRDIVNSAKERESRLAQSNSQRGKDTNGVEDQPLPKKTDQQNNLKYILNTLGLSLDPDDMSKMADRTQERLYGGKKSTEEEKGKTRDKKPARHSGRKRSKDRYSPGQYTRAGSATSSTSNRWSPAKSSSSRRRKSPQRSSRSQRRYRSPSVSPRRYRSPSLSPRRYRSPSLSPRRYRSPSLSPRRYRSPSLSPRRYRSPSLSPRRYRRSRSPYRRSRYSRSRSRDSSGDSSIDSYRDSRRDSRSPYLSYSPRSGDRWDPPRSYQSSTKQYPYPPPPLPPPPQQYYNPPYLPQMYPPPGHYATHSQYAAYNSYWGYSQTSVAWSNVPGQMPPPIMPPPIMPPPIMPPPIMPPPIMPPPIMPPPIMPPVPPSPQTDPITSIPGPPPESVKIRKPNSKPDFFSNYNKKNSSVFDSVIKIRKLELRKMIIARHMEEEQWRTEKKKRKKNSTLEGINVQRHQQVAITNREIAIRKEELKKLRIARREEKSKRRMEEKKRCIEEQKRRTEANRELKKNSTLEGNNVQGHQAPKKGKLKPWIKNKNKNNNNKKKKNQKPEGIPQHIPLMEYIQTVPELNDDEVGEKPNQKLKLEALNKGEKKPSTPSADAETKTKLDEDEVGEKPSLTEEEVKANLKLKVCVVTFLPLKSSDNNNVACA